MPRRTKIIATIGPASESPDTLRKMMSAGMDVARIGLAHGGLDSAIEKYDRIRAVAAEERRQLGILVDLPGPKVRAGAFPDGGVMLEENAPIRLTPGTDPSTAGLVHVDYDTLLEDIVPGDRLAFGDGAVNVEIESVEGDELVGFVCHGGSVQGRPGVHIPSDRLRITAPTPADLKFLDAFVELGVDIVALSFVRSAHDIRRLGVEPAPRGPLIMAKIETRAAVENLRSIVEASGSVMVARGDLGAEFQLEELPHLQKRIIRDCIALGRPAVTATQMLESMVAAPRPTRAEASDVANAVFDGSSAVMLSGETAIGRDPVNSVETMARIAERADLAFDYETWMETVEEIRLAESGDPGERITDAMTAAAWRAARQVDVAAIVCMSRTGFTVRSMARFRPDTPILGFSPNERTVEQLTLSWGVEPLQSRESADSSEMIDNALIKAREVGKVRAGDLVLVLAGSSLKTRATDVLRFAKVP
ncbi:MAG: pyruvate kinase [Actinomycetota bacterium]